MNPAQLEEMLKILQKVVFTVEHNARVRRRFDGLICLSNPAYDLYFERRDPAIEKDLGDDQEKWGYLLDCLLRYLDGSTTVLDISERHDLPFDELYAYLKRFEDKGLVRIDFEPLTRARPAR